MTLYEIAKELENFEFEIDEETGEIINMEKLDEITLARDEKIENIALWIKNLDAEASAIREEEKNLAERRRSKEKKVESLKKYLSLVLEGEKFESARAKISYRKSEIVVADDLLVIPEKYWRVKTELDKTAVKTAIRGGNVVEGCHLEENRTMQIK